MIAEKKIVVTPTTALKSYMNNTPNKELIIKTQAFREVFYRTTQDPDLTVQWGSFQVFGI